MRGRTHTFRLCAFLMKYVSIFSVTSKSAITPSFMGLMATMLPGVRPSISFASRPTASTRPFSLLMATIDGSLTTMPFPRAYTQVFAVPRSMARSLEKRENTERRLTCTPYADNFGKTLENTQASGINLYRSQKDAILSAILHVIHGRIGRLDQLFSRRGHIWQRANPDRRGEMNVEAFGREEGVCADALAIPFGDGDRAFAACIGKHDRKFVAAEASDDVGLSRAAAHHV